MKFDSLSLKKYLKGIRVIICDDDDMIIRILRPLLEKEGCIETRSTPGASSLDRLGGLSLGYAISPGRKAPDPIHDRLSRGPLMEPETFSPDRTW